MDVVVDTDEVRIEKMELGQWGTNFYIVVCRQTGKCVLVDAPPGALTIIKELNGRVPEYILLTHNHIDHITGLQSFRNRINVPLAVHPADNTDWLPFPPEKLLSDGEIIRVGNLNVEVLHTPGHTPGSVCFKIGRYLLSGDTLFPGGPGRTTTPFDFQQVVKSITRKIFPLPDDTLVYPGHGVSTVLKKEKEEFAVFSSRPHDAELFGDVAWLTT